MSEDYANRNKGEAIIYVDISFGLVEPMQYKSF